MRLIGLNVLCLFAVSFLIYGDSFVFLGLPEWTWLSLGSLDVHIFFIISAYLVSQSWERILDLCRFIDRGLPHIFQGLIMRAPRGILALGLFLTTLVYLYPQVRLLNSLLISFFLCMMLAYLSWYVVKARALALQPQSVSREAT